MLAEDIFIPHSTADYNSVLMQTIHKAFPLQIRFYSVLSEIYHLSQWAIKTVTFNHILQLLHSTEGGLTGLGPDATYSVVVKTG